MENKVEFWDLQHTIFSCSRDAALGRPPSTFGERQPNPIENRSAKELENELRNTLATSTLQVPGQSNIFCPR